LYSAARDCRSRHRLLGGDLTGRANSSSVTGLPISNSWARFASIVNGPTAAAATPASTIVRHRSRSPRTAAIAKSPHGAQLSCASRHGPDRKAHLGQDLGSLTAVM